MSTVLSHLGVIDWIDRWMKEEKEPSFYGILSTIGLDGLPKARTVAIREIDENGVLFFTQLGSEKVKEIKCCNQVSITLLLTDHKRQIAIEGKVEPLTEAENQSYWSSYPHLAQVRFLVYGPRSGEPISSSKDLDQDLENNLKVFEEKAVPCPEAYVGFRVHPTTIKLYQLNLERLSDSFVLSRTGQTWDLRRVVP